MGTNSRNSQRNNVKTLIRVIYYFKSYFFLNTTLKLCDNNGATYLFVTGTDTDVGKTFISSLLVHKWKANYWKPVQTGIESDVGDSFTISKATVDGAWQPIVFSPRYELLKPLSPYKAMEYEPGVDIKLSDFKVPDGSDEHPLIVEGAGGVLVPLTRKLESMKDLMNHLLLSSGRPFYIVVVTRSGLGTLNHTLLTVKYLQDNGLGKNILGVIINGQENKGNTQVMKDFGVPILAEVGVSETVANAVSSIPPLESLPFGSP